MQFLTKLYYFCLTSHACAWYINLIWFHFISLDSIFIYFVFRFASLILRISNRFSFQLTHTNGTQTHANWIPCGGIGCEFSATQLQLPGNCIRTGRAKKNRTGKWPTAEPLTQKKRSRKENHCGKEHLETITITGNFARSRAFDIKASNWITIMVS